MKSPIKIPIHLSQDIHYDIVWLFKEYSENEFLGLRSKIPEFPIGSLVGFEITAEKSRARIEGVVTNHYHLYSTRYPTGDIFYDVQTMDNGWYREISQGRLSELP